MNEETPIVRLTADKVDELIALFRDHRKAQVGDRLEDAEETSEMIADFTEMLQDEDEYVRFLAREALSLLETESPAQPLCLVGTRVEIIPLEIFSFGALAAKAISRVTRSPDGQLRWTHLVDDEGNVRLRFDSEALEREKSFVLKAGEWSQEFTLQRLDEDGNQLFEAEVVILKEVWDRLAEADAVITIESSSARPGDAGSDTGLDQGE
jgi:hypothetical protein